MNKEKPGYNDDSSDSRNTPYGHGPAFRPIAEHQPQLKRVPEVPRTFLADGILFDRNQIIQPHEEGTHEQDDQDEENDPEGTAAAKRGRFLTTATVPQARPLRRPPLPELHQTLAQLDGDYAAGKREDESHVFTDQTPQIAAMPAAESVTFAAPEHTEAQQYLPSQPAERAEQSLTPTEVESSQIPSPRHEVPLPYTAPVQPQFEATPPTATTNEQKQEWQNPTPDSPPYQPPTLAAQRPMPQFEAVPTAGYQQASNPNAGANSYSNQYNTPPPTYSQGGVGGGNRGGNVGGNHGGGNGNTPPPNNPNQQYGYNGGGGAAGGVNPNALPPMPAAAFERQSHTTIIQKRGSLLPYVAVLAEHIGRKRADRRLKRELGAQIKEQRTAQKLTDTEQLRLQREQQRLAEEQRRQFLINQRTQSWNQNQPAGNVGEAPRYIGAPSERFGAPMPAQAQPAEAQPAPGMQPEQQLSQAENPQLNPNQRVQQSTWHNIVVNERGQEVAGAMQYGEGFRRERQQEIIPAHTGDSMLSGGSAGSSGQGSGGYAAGGTYGYGAGTPYEPSLPSGMTSPTLPQGPLSRGDAQHQLPAVTRTKSGVPGPLFWIMVVVIIAAFFAAALI